MKYFLIFIATLITTSVAAQTNTFPSSGNVGIGTTNPLFDLEVIGNYKLHNGASGAVYSGIGIRSSNRAELHLHANDDNVSEIHFGEGSRQDSNVRWTLSSRNSSQNNNFFVFEGPKLAGNWKIRFAIKPGGNVGIGTASPDEKLTVAGTVKSREVIVEENTGADFVFEEDYNLPNLSELEDFIKANKHLPEIPTAEQMKEEGVKVGELQMKLLLKIEELTLYAIQQNKSKVQHEVKAEALQKIIDRGRKTEEQFREKLNVQQEILNDQQKLIDELLKRMDQLESEE